MLETIERLYDEIHGPKLTPYELIENVKLPNYTSVDFSKDSENNIIAYTKCLLEDGSNAIFTYVFNKENKLMSLKCVVRGSEEEVYNRKIEIEKFYLLASQSLQPSLKAI
ncbi:MULTISPECIES: hypothetical protein [Bacillus]|uniref:hypothetical protein n=1 Tax=Bacillus TaxID=1386 RepID=UPI001F5759ED|nr:MULTISPECIES: hypothetical protein [Bacillus]MCR6850324.1 hypothetical protein [Bacillus sp. IBL03825]